MRRGALLGGLALLALCGVRVGAEPNLVANPGFESGSFSGWALANETRPDHSFVSDPGWNEFLPYSGTRFAALGAIGSDLLLSQTIATIPGEPYTIRFHLGSDGEVPSAFVARWNGEPVLSLADAPETPGHDLIHGPPAAAYGDYVFTRLATGSATTIQFDARNEQGWWALDDVSVTPAPEPDALLQRGAGALALVALVRRRRALA